MTNVTPPENKKGAPAVAAVVAPGSILTQDAILKQRKSLKPGTTISLEKVSKERGGRILAYCYIRNSMHHHSQQCLRLSLNLPSSCAVKPVLSCLLTSSPRLPLLLLLSHPLLLPSLLPLRPLLLLLLILLRNWSYSLVSPLHRSWHSLLLPNLLHLLQSTPALHPLSLLLHLLLASRLQSLHPN